VAAPSKVKKRYGAKRNPTREELEAPDEIEERLVGLWEWVRKFRYVIVGVLVGAFVLVAVASLWSTHSASAQQERARALDLFNAPVLSKDEAATAGLPADQVTYETAQAKYAAISDKLAAVATEQEGTAAAELATLAGAAAQVMQGKGADAAGTLQSWLDANSGSPIAVAVAFDLANAYRAQGKAAEAEKALSAWLEREDWWFVGYGALTLGDLYNPGMGGSDASKAKGAYEKGLAAITEDVAQLAPAQFVKSELERRIAQLD
jgi:predicted negative regulator of RcsB-dependent stress response